MTLYYYECLDAKGRKISQTLEADSEQEAKERLRKQRVLVLSLSTQKKRASFRANKTDDLKGEALLTFTAQLAELLKASLPLYESLSSLTEQAAGEKSHLLLTTLCTRIKGGVSLSKAMSEFPKSFSREYVALIESGEAIGALDQALIHLAASQKKEMKLKKTLVTASLYPLVLLSFSLVVIGALLTFVVPSLEALLEGRTPGFVTSLVLGVSHFFTRGWPLYIPLFFLTCLGGYVALKKETIRSLLKRTLLRLPLLGNVLIEIALARFFRMLGTLLQGGVSLTLALSLSKKVMKQETLEQAMDEAEKRIIEGSRLSQELKKSPYIPSLVPRLLHVGEESGRLQEMALKIAELYEEEVEKKVGRFLAILQPALLLVLGGIVGLIMMGVLLPLTDIHSFLGD